MRTYCRLWSRSWLALALTIDTAAAIVTSLPVYYAVLVGLFACTTSGLRAVAPSRHRVLGAAYLVAATTTLGPEITPESVGATSRKAPARATPVNAASGAICTAAVALLQLTPWLLVLGLLVALLTWPTLLESMWRRSAGGRRAGHDLGQVPRNLAVTIPQAPEPFTPTAGLERQVDDVYLERLSTAELCLAWRQSFVWLQHAPTCEHRVRVAGCRERYLTELHRRDPDGIARWLERNPRAASGPDKFLRPEGPLADGY